MTHVQDLPDEILLNIFKYLDYFALFNVSKTCKRFRRFYKDPLVVRKTYFDNQNACDNVEWVDIKEYFKSCKFNITHLDLSFVHWLPVAELRKCLPQLRNMQHLNVIETNIYLAHVKEIVEKLQKLDSVALSYSMKDPSNLLSTWMNLNQIHFYVKDCLLQKLISSYFRLGHPDLIIKLELADDSETYENFFLKYWRQLKQFNCKRYVLTNYVPIFGHKFSERYYPFIFKYRHEKEELTHHIFIETYEGILLSNQLCVDIVDNDLVKHYTTYFSLQQEYIHGPLTLYICRAVESETKILEDYARERIRIRMSEAFFVRRYECFLDSDVPLVRHFKEKKSLKRVCMDESHLCLLAESPSNTDLPIFKKLRTSRIPQIPAGRRNVFRKIIHSNKNIESIKIITNGNKKCFKEDHSHEARLVVDANSMLDITQLVYLKHLSVTVLPEHSKDFFNQILTTCPLLEYIGVFMEFGFHHTEGLTEILHLGENMKFLRIHCLVRKIDTLLMNLKTCKTLQVLEIVDKSTVNTKKQVMSLHHLLVLVKECPSLRYLKILQHDLLKREIVQYKRYESIVRSKNKYIFVNLTDFSELEYFKLKTFNFDPTVM